VLNGAMTSPRRCFVHVGMPKTGTSYLQSILWRSGDELARQGVQMLPESASASFEMMLALREQLVDGMDPPDAFAAFDHFRDVVAVCEAPTGLVSQELLGGARPEHVARLVDALDGFEPHVIVTVRDLARFAPSAWQQHIRARGTRPFDEFLERLAGEEGGAAASYDLHRVLDRWETAVPPERIHVITLPRTGTPPEVLLDRFCSVLGVDPAPLRTADPRVNASLGLVQTELLRRVNIALGDRLPHRRAGYRQQGKTFLGGKVLRPQGGRPVRLPASMRDWCLDASRAVVSRLEAGGYDVVGDLDELIPDESAFAAEDQTVSDSELAEVAVAAIATILDKRAEERQRLTSLRGRVRDQQQRIAALSQNAAGRRSWLVPARALGRRLVRAPR
jgi:hypothetical protein